MRGPWCGVYVLALLEQLLLFACRFCGIRSNSRGFRMVPYLQRASALSSPFFYVLKSFSRVLLQRDAAHPYILPGYYIMRTTTTTKNIGKQQYVRQHDHFFWLLRTCAKSVVCCRVLLYAVRLARVQCTLYTSRHRQRYFGMVVRIFMVVLHTAAAIGPSIVPVCAS